MKRHAWIAALFVASFGMWAPPASAQGLLGGLLSNLSQLLSPPQQGVIVRTNLGFQGLKQQCLLHGCTVVGNIDNGLGQLYLVRPQGNLLANLLAGVLRLVTGILDAEVDQVLVIPPNESSSSTSGNPPNGLWDATPVRYYGTTLPDGYVNQTAVQIVRLDQAQDTFNVSGTGIVADIDTGVDPNHPALQRVLLPGYDFTRNQPGGNELNDITLSSPPSCNSCEPAFVNQHTAAMVDQHTAAMIDTNNQYSAFGHGTMVAGVIHLVAPTAQILPLKAFHADGTGNLSDILNAIYYAVQNNANVINMSFDLSQNSTELSNAIAYASSNNVIMSASSGNDGQMEVVYPAGIKPIMGVASTSNSDQRSSFSNYGNQVVFVAAPGEAIITTYPFGLYAAGWGTSFSSPFVAGTADLILDMHPGISPSAASWGLSHGKYVGPNMGYGRLDVYDSLFFLNPIQGLLP
jgi:subtilisin family serine protease